MLCPSPRAPGYLGWALGLQPLCVLGEPLGDQGMCHLHFLLVLEGKGAEKIPQGHEGGRPPSEQSPVSRRASPGRWGCSLCSSIFHAGPS